MKKILTDNKCPNSKKIKRKRKKYHYVMVFLYFPFGHLKHFQIAKSYSDILIVSLTSDKFVNKGKNDLFLMKIKIKLLASLEIIDYVFISNNRSQLIVLIKLNPIFILKVLSSNILIPLVRLDQ